MGAEGPYHGASPWNGISLHYYTLPTGNWEHKGSAIGFPESEWALTLKRTRDLEGMIEQHAAIMDKADPQKKIGLMVDEWGTWYDPAPGTNSPSWCRRTLFATPLSRRPTSTSSCATPTACGWRKSLRW